MYKKLAIVSSVITGSAAMLMPFATYAVDEASAFVVNVTPDNLDIGEAADLQITAIDDAGETIQDYEGTIYMVIQGGDEGIDYTLPVSFEEGGFYDFTLSQQGTVTFSKGLEFSSAGTYTLELEDFFDIGNVKGTATIIVGDPSATAAVQGIEISTPSNNQTIASTTVTVIGQQEDLPNTTVEVLVNGIPTQQDITTDDLGKFTATVSTLNEGNNTLQVRMVGLDNNLLATTEALTVTVDPTAASQLIKSIGIDPQDGELVEGQQATFQIQTDISVSAATLIVNGTDRRIMQSTSPGVFTHTSAFNEAGIIPIGIEMATAQGQENVDNITTLTVIEGAPTIQEIKAYTMDIETDKINVSWTVNGTPTSFDISYGKDQANLDMTKQTTQREIILDNIEEGETYYIRIQALDAQGQQMGPSKVHTFEPTHNAAPSCTVQGISLWMEEMGEDNFYLKWNPVENANNYAIYKSDYPATSISQMQMVTTVNTTQYQYPFSAHAQSEQYAYYAVVANCADGSQLQVENIKHVKVGPVENALMILFGAGVLYYIRRLYKNI